jgi:hypothetical protein
MRPFVASFEDYENVVGLATTEWSILMKLQFDAMVASRAMRSSVGGWVRNKLASPLAENGFRMSR